MQLVDQCRVSDDAAVEPRNLYYSGAGTADRIRSELKAPCCYTPFASSAIKSFSNSDSRINCAQEDILGPLKHRSNFQSRQRITFGLCFLAMEQEGFGEICIGQGRVRVIQSE